MMEKKILPYLIALLLTMSLFGSTNTLAAPKKLLWPVWQAYQVNATQTIDHQLWQQFLTKYVYMDASGVNLVHYDKVSPADKAKLQYYLNQLSHIPIAHYNRDEQLAYWINLYNALTVMTVLNHYPVHSIRDIKLNGFWHDGPWDAKLITIDNIELSLNDIEHRIIRPIWQDPRTHYALNCASLGCPNLQITAYTGATINNKLTADARQFINSSRAVSINQHELILSSIYDWYRMDFGTTSSAIIQHLVTYANPSLAQQLKTFKQIDGYQYNWQLNEESA